MENFLKALETISQNTIEEKKYFAYAKDGKVSHMTMILENDPGFEIYSISEEIYKTKSVDQLIIENGKVVVKLINRNDHKSLIYSKTCDSAKATFYSVPSHLLLCSKINSESFDGYIKS